MTPSLTYRPSAPHLWMQIPITIKCRKWGKKRESIKCLVFSTSMNFFNSLFFLLNWSWCTRLLCDFIPFVTRLIFIIAFVPRCAQPDAWSSTDGAGERATLAYLQHHPRPFLVCVRAALSRNYVPPFPTLARSNPLQSTAADHAKANRGR